MTSRDGNGDRFDGLDCEVVTTREGATAVRDRLTGEVMHPVVGPIAEAERLYVSPSRLRARLQEPSDRPLVLFDVGLGAGSNAMAAWRASAERIGDGARELRRLSIVSFDRSLGALALAASDEHAEAFGFTGEGREAARALLERGVHQGSHASWRLVLGELPGALTEASAGEDAAADVVFWDPFSPRANPSLWTSGAFAAVHQVCRPGATLHTYSGATATRSAMLLGGFAVGFGPVTGDNKRASIGALDPASLDEPLDLRWLERLARSSAAFPVDAPPDALERIRRLPQFSR